MVEPPGTAPGSDPVIPCAFMSIVRANPNRLNIGAGRGGCKGGAAVGKGGGARGALSRARGRLWRDCGGNTFKTMHDVG